MEYEQYSLKKRDYHWETAEEYPADLISESDMVDKVRKQRVLAEKPMRVIKVTTTIEEIEVFK